MGSSSAKPLTPPDSAEIVVVSGPYKGRRFSFAKEVISIGRGEENEISLIEDSRVSRRHVELRRESGSVVARNVSGKNYMLLDGKVINEGTLSQGGKLQVGESVLELAVVPYQVPTNFLTQSPPPLAVPIAAAGPHPVASHSAAGGVTGAFAQSKRRAPAAKSNGFNPFYIVITFVVIVAIFLFTGQKKKNKRDDVKTSGQIEEQMRLAEDEVKTHMERVQRLEGGVNSPAFRSAQEYFTRGVREFYNGQYGRAIMAFQVVLNNDPNNQQARYYWGLAKTKFDQQVEGQMKLGLDYRERKSWRKCMSYFSVVMTLLEGDQSDIRYRQAKIYYEECDLALRGRY